MIRDDKFDVVGTIDRKPGRAEEVAKRHRLRHFAETTNLSEVQWLEQVDAVTVASAPMAHYKLIKDALLLGKHVLTEKPFVMTTAEARDVIEIAKARNLQLAIVHNFQFARSSKRLMRDIASGALGTIRGIDAVQFGNPRRRLPEWYEQLPLGLFYDESPHLLYLMRAVAGPLRLSRAMQVKNLAGQNTPARVEAWFEASGGYPIRLGCNFESPVSEWYLMVFGENRLGIVDVFRDIYISLPNDGTHDTRRVFTTSLVATFQHWIQHITSGIPHLMGRHFYGNEEVFARFGRAVIGNADALGPIDSAVALEVLQLQHLIIHTCQTQ
jgi:scyllo-inositol 2-dehydrogenase (NADP+)